MTEAAIAAAREFWALGDGPIRLIAARENRVYRVETAADPRALRLHRPGYRTNAELMGELDWMDMLARSGLSVPGPFAGAGGGLLHEAGGYAMDLLSWVDGVPMQAVPPEAGMYHALGSLMARMHDLADRWTPPVGFTRPTWDLVGEAPSWGRFWENPRLDAEQARTLTRFRDLAREQLADGHWDTGLIHADLVPENVLESGGRLSPIDFDDGGYGPRLFDIATVTHRSRRVDASGALVEAVVAGYAEHRPLDITTLPLMEALRASTYVGWIVPRMGEEGAAARHDRFVSEALAAISRV